MVNDGGYLFRTAAKLAIFGVFIYKNAIQKVR